MTGRRSYGQDCPIANGLDVLGERWTLLILRELVGGPRRYSDLRAQLSGIATNLLAQRLDELQQAGVVARTELAPPIARTVYTLCLTTPLGRDDDRNVETEAVGNCRLFLQGPMRTIDDVEYATMAWVA